MLRLNSSVAAFEFSSSYEIRQEAKLVTWTYYYLLIHIEPSGRRMGKSTVRKKVAGVHFTTLIPCESNTANR